MLVDYLEDYERIVVVQIVFSDLIRNLYLINIGVSYIVGVKLHV